MTRFKDAIDFTWTLLQGKPTTLAGLGITDAASDSELAAHAGVVATDTVSGHVKVDGTTVTIASGVISAAGGGAAPSGAAGGVLGGTYPDPGFAVDMATQAELDSEASTRASADLLRLLVASNLSDLANAGTARTNLGLGALATLASITASLISDASANGRSLITATDYAAMKTLLDLVIGMNVQAWDADLDTLAGMGATRAALLSAATVNANTALLGPASGAAAAPTQRVLVQSDLPALNTYAGGTITDHLLAIGASAVVTGPLGLFWSSSGTAVSAAAPPDATALGVAQLTTGTSATGTTGFRTSQIAVRFGGVAQQIAVRFQMPTLLDGTESGAVHVGFLDSVAAVPTDGAYIYWDNTQTNFRARSRSNSVETDTDLAVAPAAATWYIGVTTVNAAGTSVRFDLYNTDGTSLLASVSNTTNIPTAAGRETGFGASIIKSAGTTARLVYLDSFRFAWGSAAV